MDNTKMILMVFGVFALFGLVYLLYSEQEKKVDQDEMQSVVEMTSDSYDVDSEIYS